MSLFDLRVVVVIRILRDRFLSYIIVLSSAYRRFLIRYAFLMIGNVTTRYLTLRVRNRFLRRLIKKNRRSVTNVINFCLLCLITVGRCGNIQFLSYVAYIGLLRVYDLNLRTTARVLVRSIVRVFCVIAIRFLSAFRLPFNGRLANVTQDVNSVTLCGDSIAAVSMLSALLIYGLPVVINEAIALTSSATRVATLTNMRLTIDLSIRLLTAIYSSRLSIIIRDKRR